MNSFSARLKVLGARSAPVPFCLRRRARLLFPDEVGLSLPIGLEDKP